MADDLYKIFDRNATRAENDWQRNFVLPYGSAYVIGRRSFQDNLDKQKKADEERQQRIAALAMFALSLCGGSILTHVFGSACAKTLAGKVALDVICKGEMNRAFKVASFISENKTAEFAVGKLWDSAADLLPDLKAKLAETTSNFPSLTKFAQEPQVLQNHLEKWVKDAYAGLLAAEDEISRTIKDEKKKTEMVMQLIDSPFVRTAPAKEVAEESTAEDIEFSFYMNVIRDLDYVEHVTVNLGNGGITRTKSRVRSIDESPGSANYPKNKMIGPGGTDYEDVAFDGLGDILRDRVDELHKKRFNKTAFFLRDETISSKTIIRAEQKLGELSNINLNLIRQSLAARPSPTGLPKSSNDLKTYGSFPVPVGTK